MLWFLNFIFGVKLYMFRTVPLSIIRSFSLYTQQKYVIQVCWPLASMFVILTAARKISCNRFLTSGGCGGGGGGGGGGDDDDNQLGQ